MNALLTRPPPQPTDDAVPSFPIYRVSVAQYHRMLETGVLSDGDPVELVDGWLVPKMTKNPPHRSAAEMVRDALALIIRPGWIPQSEGPITLSRSEPEPDVVIARGTRQDYLHRHPLPADIGLVVEVSDSSLAFDQGPKKRAYAHDRLVCYWIVNLVDWQIEVYSEPTGEGAAADYAAPRIYRLGQRIPLDLDGRRTGEVAVSDVLPPR